MNALAVWGLVGIGVLAAICLVIYRRERGRNAPSHEHGRVEKTWGGGDKNPYGGATHDGAQRHYGNTDATGGGNP
ncbi:hypothetical protein [Phytomonospora endophytica]|uniref:Uncharacterized protein n=1 Tax=Phytomonospora endophytica TaxID=714109 RepID=A0A841FV88_9ACTN|nr:hypothetical protein [Phytomonospora endophytica]MBB6036419.1 hypothetical protein [Phytomonospora endophytica]GIG65742.1 hypothetical protein Pen01_20370 [Phytomonospora endophytica]